MDSNQRLHLQKMITTNNVEDNTGLIRQLKHSLVLRENINNLIMLKAKYMDDPDSLHLEGMSECTFLFTYYTDLYNKIRKDEIDLKILFKALDVLRDIEDGKLDQHEGAYEFGTLLKKQKRLLRQLAKQNRNIRVLRLMYLGANLRKQNYLRK